MENKYDINTLNVLYSSDDNYAQHMGVSIYSLLDTNRDFDEIRVFIINNAISEENCQKLNALVSEFSNARLEFIAFDNWASKLSLNMAWNISISSYARLFVGSMLPVDVHRVLYLDCDMIIRKSLCELWETDLQGNVLGAVQDSVGAKTKSAIHIAQDAPYFNAGMLLVDLIQWREQRIENKCIAFLDQHGGNVSHHDQGILNGVLKNSWFRLPIVYNLMTIHFIFNQRQISCYFEDKAEFYSEDAIENGKKNAVVLHFTPSFTTRPWIRGCCHPFKQLYWELLNKTPWNGEKEQRDSRRWYLKVMEWKYRHFFYKT